MTHRPFEDFCKESFIDSTGNVQNINSNTKEARNVRIDRHKDKLTKQLHGVVKLHSDLQQELLKLETGSDAAAIFIKRIEEAKRRINNLENEIKKADNRYKK